MADCQTYTGLGHAYSITYLNVATLQLKYFCCLVDIHKSIIATTYSKPHLFNKTKDQEKGKNPYLESLSIEN